MANIIEGDISQISFGQAGSIHVAGTTAVTTSYGVFVAITFLEDTIFASGAAGLIPESSQKYPSSDGASTDIDSDGGVAVDSESFRLVLPYMADGQDSSWQVVNLWHM